MHPPPLRSLDLPDFDPLGDEWANTLTHAGGFVLSLGGSAAMAYWLQGQTTGVVISCAVYCAAVMAVYLFSTLSHAVFEPDLRHAMRAWDQGAIYLMISGTYTPFAWQYSPPGFRIPLLLFLWIVAAVGFWSKVIAQHRVNALATTSYLLLGWVPAIPLAPQVPLGCLLGMAAGGVLFTIGVVFLKLDRRYRFFHAAWHVCVIAASICHFATVAYYVAMV